MDGKRGDVDRISSELVDVRGQQAFVEVFRREIKGAGRGQLVITADVFGGSAFLDQFLAVEVQTIGYLGSTPTVLARAALSRTHNQQRVEFSEEDSFDVIAVEARQIVNGAPSGATTPQRVAVGVQGRFWR